MLRHLRPLIVGIRKTQVNLFSKHSPADSLQPWLVVGLQLFSNGVYGAMSDAILIALFSVGMASTSTVLFLAFRRTYRLEQERTLMPRIRRRLDRIFLKQKL